MKMLMTLATGTFVILTPPVLSQSQTMPQEGMGHGMAQKMQTATIAIENPWARASLGKNGAAYATLVNKGGTPDRLVAVKSSVAARVEIHTHIKDGDIMRMREVKGGIPLAPGKSVTMKPGGYHVMLMGLNTKLETGSSFPVTFVFEKAGAVNTMVTIGKVGSMGPAKMPSMPDTHQDGHSGSHSGGHSGGHSH